MYVPVHICCSPLHPWQLQDEEVELGKAPATSSSEDAIDIEVQSPPQDLLSGEPACPCLYILLNFFLTGGLRPPDPPNKSASGLPD